MSDDARRDGRDDDDDELDLGDDEWPEPAASGDADDDAPNLENAHYLAAKRDKLGHKLHHQDLKFEPELESE